MKVKLIPGLSSQSQTKQRDAYIGCVSHYDYDKIEPLVRSLELSGFTGDKIMIAWTLGGDVIKRLQNKGWNIIIPDSRANLNPNGDMHSPVHPARIVVERFDALYRLLAGWEDRPDWRYIITTDVKDVIFQRNPSDWLDENFNAMSPIHVGSECLAYKDEPWGNDNMQKSFPLEYERMRDRIIYNCGTITATPDYLKGLAFSIYNLCQLSRIHNPDQAALNVLLSMAPWCDVTSFNSMQSGYAVQLGTVNDPNKLESFRPFLTEHKLPYLGEDGIVRVSHNDGENKIIPMMVHQYDRNPKWKQIIEAKYKE